MVVVTRISFDLRWYIITDTSITVRQGAWTVREITVSYQNIQNERIAGLLERYFGFANL
ncbi:MAG: PH domain-containing protein [Ignavibacteria bacterium]|nr:PH domain-containing protein [Ignavibacteria bacterium]